MTRFFAGALYHSLASIEGLRCLSPVSSTVGIGQTKKRLSLGPLAHFADLRLLSFEGQTKDKEVGLIPRQLAEHDPAINHFAGPFDSAPAEQPRAFALKLGGTRNLVLLPETGRIEYLEIRMVRALEDLSPIARLQNLQYLCLQSLKHVTALPDLLDLVELETVWLQTMKGLTDLTPLPSAPSLRRLALCEMAHLQPADVGVLAQHSSLRQSMANLGSFRKNETVARLVPLPAGDGWNKPSFALPAATE